MFEIEYEFRQEDLIHFNEVRLKNNTQLQSDLRKHRFLIMGILLFISFFYYIYYKDMQTPAYILGFGAVWLFIFKPYETKMDMRRQILAKYSEEEKKNLFGNYQLSIEQQHLLVKSPSGKEKMLWKDLVRVEYGDKYVYVYVDLDSALIIPVSTLSKGNLEEFAEHAEGMIERAT
jgi:YcxB-like protein